MREQALKVYDQLVEKSPGVERKGKTMPYTSSNGYMFSQLNKAGEIGIRLPKEAREEFLERYDSGPFLSYGAVMREYVLVPQALWEDIELLSTYLVMAHDYVNSLEPK